MNKVEATPATNPVRLTRAALAGAHVRRAAVANVSPRITYWTGWLSPEMEGSSKEVFALKDHFPRSRVFGLSRYYMLKASIADRYFGLSVRLYPLFRAIAPLWDATSDVNHIYGSLDEWFFLRTLRRRPIVMTIATATPPLEAHQYRHVRRFVTHSNRTTKRMIRWGFDADKITRIYPGVDLARFRPAPRSEDPPFPIAQRDPSRFRLLFATAPNWVEGLKARGVELMMQAARRLPDVDFYLLWRPWAGGHDLIERCRREAPENVHVSTELVANMTQMFHAADAVVAPFVRTIRMKVCPTSLIESLACGRPLLVSMKVGIADLVRDEQCGVVIGPTVDGFCRGIAELRSRYDHYARNARPSAERHFNLAECLRQHEDLYEEVLR